jgi:hypothetical protein
MRIERAIDGFLDWRRLERDAMPRSVDSYWRILWKLAQDYPEIELGRVRRTTFGSSSTAGVTRAPRQDPT